MPCRELAILSLIAVGLTANLASSVSAQSTDTGAAFFEKSIRPVLVKHCYECHSAAAASKGKLKAGLALDTKQGMLTGGESGPAVVPGDVKKSLLIAALKHEMPPSGRLPAEVIEHFTKWVDMGAPDPRADAAPTPRREAFRITGEDRNHWAYQPVRNVPPPKVTNVEWVRQDLDRFVLARLERTGSEPSAPADKHALLRRATYALTGLPPTPDEIARFVSDKSPDAYEKVVDRLLGSPEFGVQWGRRWLDGVRYADSVDKSGEYRSWVIRAFNDDLPFDRFVKMQIAGDLMLADRSDPRRIHASGASLDGITATGMMTLAVWEQVGRDLAVAEIVDSQIDLVGRHLLGLTLACARCHDHKFDPISTEDYYAMAGVFFSSHIATGKLIADARLGNELIDIPLLTASDDAANRKIDAEIATIEARGAAIAKKVPQAARLMAVQEQIKDLEGQIARATATTKKSLTDQAAKLKTEQKSLTDDRLAKKWDDNPPELKEIVAFQQQIAALRKIKITAPLAAGIAEGGVPGSNREKIGDAPVYLRGEYQREGAIVPRRFPTILAGERQTPLGQRTKQSGRLELAEWIASAENPLTARVMVNRIWHQLVGRGLVRSLDNFGRLGDRPTHPELLDHLAHRFVASKWSVKKMVREIMLSATYQQASFVAPEAAKADPDNQYIGHMNRRRLTYEELRDSLMMAGGKLVLGPPTAKDTAERRTIYEPLDRRKTNVTAAIFDGPDSKAIVPSRAETTTAPQALFLLNSPLVADMAKRLADRLAGDTSLKTDEQRLERLWLTALGRPPVAEESETALRYIAQHSWAGFIQALLSTNEFTYID
ncbi:MAG: PSD1 and planctomycete cytochrome C domain-containing protein [Planctomycetes bacterium]|nr:PSD1 and planctomycete cytochrome C domain-containing protein [Planctomycetota bacterium]